MNTCKLKYDRSVYSTLFRLHPFSVQVSQIAIMKTMSKKSYPTKEKK